MVLRLHVVLVVGPYNNLQRHDVQTDSSNNDGCEKVLLWGFGPLIDTPPDGSNIRGIEHRDNLFVIGLQILSHPVAFVEMEESVHLWTM